MNDEYAICKQSSTKKIQAVSSIFAGKWAFVTLAELHDGPKRFNALNRTLNISTKSLTDTLKRLEQNGIIDRKVFATVPATVEYSLTDKGKDFESVLLSMKIWADTWLI